MKQNLDISAKAVKIDVSHMWENFKVNLLPDEMRCVLPEASATFSCRQGGLIKKQNIPQGKRLFAWIRCDEWNTHMRNIYHTAKKYGVAAEWSNCLKQNVIIYGSVSIAYRKSSAHGKNSSPEVSTC